MKYDIISIKKYLNYKLKIQDISLILITVFWILIDLFNIDELPYDIWKPITVVIGCVIMWMSIALKDFGDESNEKTYYDDLLKTSLSERVKHNVKTVYYSYLIIAILLIIFSTLITRFFVSKKIISAIVQFTVCICSSVIMMHKDKKIIDILINELNSHML